MASIFKHLSPLYDPIKAQFAVLSCEESLHKKAVLLEILIKAAYKGEAELKSSLIDSLKGVEIPNSDEWLCVKLQDLDLHRLDRIIKYQKLFLHTEKDDIGSIDYIIFCAFTLVCDDFMVAEVKLDTIRELTGVTNDELLDTVEFLFEKRWLENTHEGYQLTVPFHVSLQKTSWVVKEDKND